MALTPIALVVFGVGRAGEGSTVLTGLATAANNSSTASDPTDTRGPWPEAAPDGASFDPSVSPAAAPSVSPVAAPSVSPATGSSTSVTVARTSLSAAAVVPRTATVKAVGLTAAAQTLDDLAYAGGSAARKLDLYLPTRTGTAVPLVVVIHGGAFMGGSKGDYRGRAEDLVGRGYAVASIDYRLSDEAPFPAGAEDVKAAVRWLRAAAPRYGVDPGRFAAWGDSAGGYFAALLGATSGRVTSFDDPALGNPTVSSSVQAVVDFYGPVDFLTMDRQAASPGGCTGQAQAHDEAGSPESLWLGSPVQSVSAVARTANPISYLASSGVRPPFFIAHGTADCSVPHGQSLELSSALRARGITNTTYLLPGIDHGDPQLDTTMQPLVVAFLERWLGKT